MREIILSSLITILAMLLFIRSWIRWLEKQAEDWKELFHASEDMWLHEYERNKELQNKINELINSERK